MAKITAIAIQKGGQGKTVTAYALGAGLALRGQRVLLSTWMPKATLAIPSAPMPQG